MPYTPRYATLGSILVLSFASTIAMWCAAIFLHSPILSLTPSQAGPALLTVLILSFIIAGRSIRSANPLRIAVAVGLLVGLLNLLILGSTLTHSTTTHTLQQTIAQDNSQASPQDSTISSPTQLEIPSEPNQSDQPATGTLKPNAVWTALGSIALTTFLSTIFMTLGTRLKPHCSAAPQPNWLARFGIVTVTAMIPLLLIGGLVTSGRAGMSVPDWPNSYGANMFLLPISAMADSRIFLEHTHRLFGSLVGFTSLTFVAYALLAGPTRRSKIAPTILFLLIAFQGYLGGIRVTQASTILAISHGVLAQLTFALACCIAAWLTSTFQADPTWTMDPKDRRRKTLATAFFHASMFQLILGSVYRHMNAAEIQGAGHALMTHAAFSIFVVILAAIAASTLGSRHTDEPVSHILKLISRSIYVVVSLQFALGMLALGMVMMTNSADQSPPPTAGQLASTPTIPPMQLIIATAHQLNGAFTIALAALGVSWSRRINAAKKMNS